MKTIVKSPLITEKNTNMSELSLFVFEVGLSADKIEIKNQIEKMFSVKVEKVRTSICRGDSKNSKFGKSKVQKWKKAYVQLPKGTKLSIFEGV